MELEAEGAGAVSLRYVPGPPAEPAVVLLHGWTATADLNWLGAYEPLGEAFTLFAPDLAGHGASGPLPGRFSLAGCADAVAGMLASAAEAGLRPPGPVTVAGYSMGGAVAQLLALRHPGLVGAVVLCSSAARFFPDSFSVHAQRLAIHLLAAAMAEVPRRCYGRVWDFALQRKTAGFGRWVAEEVSRSDPASLLGAAAALRAFDSRGWLGRLPIPVAVLVTTADEVVSPVAQQAMFAAASPPKWLVGLEGGHAGCVERPERFAEALLEACRWASEPRAGTTG